MQHLKATLRLAVLLGMGAVFTLAGEPSWAASHSDALLIKQDP